MSDTLDKIGHVHDTDPGRDAVHIAVLPVVAGETLHPGTHVDVRDGVALAATEHAPTNLGIIDPYLPKAVQAGERCYVFLYPQTITSLRHVWTHPEIHDLPDHVARQALDALGGERSSRWLRRFAELHAHTYERLIEEATEVAKTGRGSIGTRMNDDPSELMTTEFWEHIKNVTGVTVLDTVDTRAPFACAC